MLLLARMLRTIREVESNSTVSGGRVHNCHCASCENPQVYNIRVLLDSILITPGLALLLSLPSYHPPRPRFVHHLLHLL